LLVKIFCERFRIVQQSLKLLFDTYATSPDTNNTMLSGYVMRKWEDIDRQQRIDVVPNSQQEHLKKCLETTDALKVIN